MKDQSLRVLMVSDSENDELLIIRQLKKGGYNPVYERVDTASTMKKALRNKQWDIILCDCSLPKFNGPSAISLLKETNIDIPLVVVTGAIGEETAVNCMRLGAQDYVMMDNLSRLCPVITRELEESKVRNKQKDTDEALRKASLDWQVTFDATSDAICLLDTDQRILRCNYMMTEMFGMKQEDLIGRPCWEIVHGTKEPIPECPITRMKSSLVRENMDLQMGDRWFNVTADPILDEKRTLQDVVHIVRDITERKNAEEALKDNETKFRTLFEFANDTIFLMDNDIFIDCNQKTLEMFGCTREQIIGQPPYQFSPKVQPDGRNSKEKAQEKINAAINGQPQFFEWKHCRYDGTLFDAEIGLNTFKNKNKYFIQAIVRDITERKHRENKLRESEEGFKAMADASPLAIYVSAGIEQKAIYINPTFVQLFGYTLDEVPSVEQWWPLAYPDENYRRQITDEWTKKVERAIETKSTIEPMDAVVTCKDGSKKNILWGYVSLGEKNFAYGFNLTEQKKAEEKIKNSEAKYRNIFENAVEGIYQATIEGRIITANAAFARMAGYGSPEELIESIKDIETQLYVHPEDRNRFLEIIKTKGFIEGFEVEFYKKNRSKFWVVVNARTVKDEQGKVLHIEGLIEDITIRKHAEEQLHQTLERLKRAVGTTIGVLVSAAESRDPYTAGHQLRVADLARAIAMEIGFPQDKIEGLHMAGSVHDIGKLSIPAEILTKPTKLTNIEFSLIKQHSKSGYEMLKDVEAPWPLAEIVHQHHERMNGTGYPRNLKGDEILMEARIMAVADVVEAMASHRPYRAALGIEVALKEIEKNKGIFYDDTVSDACLRLFREKGYQFT
jgi:PAS domain S-box-containing protein